MRSRNVWRVLLMVGALALLAATVPIGGAGANGVANGTYPLYAGQDIPVGFVTVTNDTTDLYVTFSTESSSWCMTETHLQVADDLVGIPQTKKFNPIPGQFDYGMDHDCVQTYTYPVPLADAISGETLVIAAHAVVYDMTSEESMTIYSDSNVDVTSFNGIAQIPAPAVAAFEPVGYQNCGSYVQSPVTGSVWDTQTGGSASNDPGGPFDGATWIWRTANPEFPDAGEYATFERTFDLPGLPTTGSILITADNGYQVSLNGAFLGQAQIYSAFPGSLAEDGVNTTNWQSPETWALPIQSGSNTLSIVAANEEAYPDTPNQHTTGIGGVPGGLCPNPGGLIFKAEVGYYADHESAWGATGPEPGEMQFEGKNWATYFTYTVQRVLVDTVTVPANAILGANSTSLDAASSYEFNVTGTTTWENAPGPRDIVDALCVNTLNAGWTTNYPGYGDELLDLQVDESSVAWVFVGTDNAGDPGCADGHEYTLDFGGSGAPVNFRILDGAGGVPNPGWYGDNVGSLTVDIYWVG